MVKTILDEFCVKSGVLCVKCEEKLRKGQVSQLDFKVIKVLTELEKEYPVLKKVFFHKSIDAGNTLAILVDKKDMIQILSQGGKIIKALAEKIGKKRIKLLSYGSSEREFLEELLSPFSILTVNTVWLPDGSTETKVILPGRKPKRLPIDFEEVKKIAKEVKGMSLRIEFEKA
jgi:transcription antitermination factor NusA-like protein